MRIFGIDIPEDQVPEGTFKRLISCKGEFLWYLTALDVTEREKQWIKTVLESRKQQLLAGTPLDKLTYEQPKPKGINEHGAE